MRLSNTQAVARPSYYDRNEVPKSFRYIATVAPHTTTVRWTYTVPVGKKAWMDSALAWLGRATAAAPVALAFGWVRYTPSGGSATTMVNTTLATNGVNDNQQSLLSSLGAMVAGDVVEGLTVDTSTGGTVTYDVNLKYAEFDA